MRVSMGTGRKLALFFALAYALSWSVWLPLVLRARGVELPVFPFQHDFGAIGPIAAACVVTGVFDGNAALRSLLSRLSPWRASAGWLSVSAFGPILLFLLGWSATGVFTRQWSDLSMLGKSAELPGLGPIETWLFHLFTFGIGEEVGWRGFALPRLQASRSAFRAALWLTLAWAGWHLPAFFYQPGFAAMGPGAIVGWLLSLATGSVLLTWIFNNTKGSLFAVSVFHGTVDFVFTSEAATGSVSGITGMLMVLLACVVVVVYKPSTLTRSGAKPVAPRAS